MKVTSERFNGMTLLSIIDPPTELVANQVRDRILGSRKYRVVADESYYKCYAIYFRKRPIRKSRARYLRFQIIFWTLELLGLFALAAALTWGDAPWITKLLLGAAYGVIVGKAYNHFRPIWSR